MTRHKDAPRPPRTDNSPAEFIDRPQNLPGDKVDPDPSEAQPKQAADRAEDGEP